LPTAYPPPAQRPSLTVSPAGFGHFVAMSDPNAGAYIVQGFRERSEGPWRWALDCPVLRFYLPSVGRVRFTAEFTFPEQNFRQTGPVTITFRLNGTVFDRVRYDQPGGHEYSHPAPPELVRQNGINTVAMEPDKAAANGSEKLGFVLTHAGFAE
jgi:hypothetical protein